MLKRLILLSLALLVTLPVLTGCGYNQIQKNEEGVFAAWADVEATYQRRADLIPNLVETVKAYAAHEQETLLAVTEARASVGKTQISSGDLADPAAMQNFQQAQGALSGAL
ncbi:MAG: LemA family protein, partial [Desulfuromonadales bacterium]|nr:LemA family protein [Desulfuromonadales bacterium]